MEKKEMTTDGMHTAELLYESQISLDSGQWETALTYARSAYIRDPSNLQALILQQAAIVELLAGIYQESGLMQELLTINRVIREIDTR